MEEETEYQAPSVASQVLGAAIGATVVIVGLRVVVGIKRRQRKNRELKLVNIQETTD